MLLSYDIFLLSIFNFYMISAKRSYVVRSLLRAEADFFTSPSFLQKYLSKSYTYILPYGPSPAPSSLLSLFTHNQERNLYLYSC
jgi:hypothetical protein